MTVLKLRDYQLKAVHKLYKKRSILIGDDMGLGKTITAIAIDMKRRHDALNGVDAFEKIGPSRKVRKTLIVAPLSTLTTTWEQHLRDNTNQDVYVIDPKNRKPFIDAAKDGWKGGYFVCHWDALRLKDMAALRKVAWFHIIADEVHRAKNRKALTTRALKALPTIFKTGLSGTPADDKPQDIWSVLNWLWPKFYTSYWRFVNTHCIFKELIGSNGNSYKKIIGVQNLHILHKQMESWYIRRLKDEVAKELPDKFYTQVVVDLLPQQRRAYNEMRKTMVAWVKDHKKEIEEESPLIANVIVAQLQRLQQFALAYMYQDGYVKKKIKDPETGDITEVEVPRYLMSEPSSKLDALMELLEDNPNEQFVVFSQFKQIINLLAHRLDRHGISYGLLTGDTKQSDRDTLVREFQAGKVRIFAGTIAAGGIGITLTAASRVVFLDRAWKPTANRQAEDRLHRIGQENAVQVFDFIAKGTLDRARLQQLEMKWDLIRQVLGDK